MSKQDCIEGKEQADKLCREIREVSRYDLNRIVTAICCNLVEAGKQERSWTADEHKIVSSSVKALMLAAKHYKNGSTNDPEVGMDAKGGEAHRIAEKIAKEVLEVDTLETRYRDGLDFYDLPVWELRKALITAYEAGKKATTN